MRQIAYSTFTILQLFHDGRAYLVEFDNPACIFIRNGKLMEVPYELREIAGKTVRESKFDVNLGDMFALVSDGVVFAGVGAILNLGWQWENVAQFFLECAQKKMSVYRTVASVAQVVDNFYMQKPGDDSTFLVAQAVPRKNIHFFSGPPVDKEQDEKLVRDFMRGACKRIVAGGTSANIVARVLGRDAELHRSRHSAHRRNRRHRSGHGRRADHQPHAGNPAHVLRAQRRRRSSPARCR